MAFKLREVSPVSFWMKQGVRDWHEWLEVMAAEKEQ